MTPPKPSAKTTLINKFRAFMDALSDRYQQVLKVIDEALASESLKDRSWAVDIILKRALPPEGTAEKAKSKKPKAPTLAELSRMSDEELMQRIQQALPELEE